MKLYKLPISMHEPSGDTEFKYMAEIADLPGCRAWGNTAAEALENLQAVATAFIESYRDRGDPLPPLVERAAIDAGVQATGEVLVAAWPAPGRPSGFAGCGVGSIMGRTATTRYGAKSKG